MEDGLVVIDGCYSRHLTWKVRLSGPSAKNCPVEEVPD